jgi:predicted dehydrogenase
VSAVKVGIIGCGEIAKAHLEPLKGIDVDVVGVCDPNEQSSARLAAAFGISRRYHDATELLDRERPEVVHIITPPRTHRDLAVEAIEAGCHVLVEKPMAMDAAEADEMIAASRRRGCALGVSHTQLFDPAVLKARELTTNGELGRILSVETMTMFGEGGLARNASTGWIEDLPGGALQELGPHFVYLHREFLGNLTVVSALTKAVPELPSPAIEFRALLEGESGSGSAALSFAGRPQQAVMRIYGTEMSLHVDIRNHLLVRARRGAAGGNVSRTLVNIDLGARFAVRAVTATAAGLRRPWLRGHDNLIRRFYEALADGRDPPVTGEDGRAVVAVLDQLWERTEAIEGSR